MGPAGAGDARRKMHGVYIYIYKLIGEGWANSALGHVSGSKVETLLHG